MSDGDGSAWRILRWAEHAVVAGVLLYGANKLLEGPGLKTNVMAMAIRAARVVPGGNAIMEAQQKEAVEAIEKMVLGKFADEDKVREIPENGRSPENIRALLEEWRGKEEDFHSGKAFGGIYHDGEEHEQLIRDTLSLYADSNALYPAIFPGLRKFEAELVSMTVSMLHGGADGCGAVTSGGTESILLAAKAYRERGRALFGIEQPEMLITDTAHAAFRKAAHYFGIKPVMIPVVGPHNQRTDVKKLREAMNANVVMVVASAPTFPHGCIDPIEEIGKVVLEYPHAGFHVDSCLGAFCLPWLTKLGHVTKKFDFLVPGVTSMSADIHKYGFGPKGVSVICYRDPSYRKYQYFTYTDWSGGLYCSPGIQGSRSGGPIAAAWASVIHLGQHGYLECAQEMWRTFTAVRDGINAIEGLQVICEPDACSIAWVADDPALDIFKVADAMQEHDWSINRLQLPRCLQIQIGHRSSFDSKAFIETMAECVEKVRAHPERFKGGVAGIYGMAADLASAKEVETVSDILHSYMDVLLRV